MDLSKLDLLSTEALKALRDRADRIVLNRTTQALRHGSIGWFTDKHGAKRWLRVERLNQKTVTAMELEGPAGPAKGMRWRVSTQLFNLLPPESKPTTTGSAW